MREGYIWKNSELVPWNRAQVHVLTHALHYGSSVFEGLRAYEIGDDAAVFCGTAHFERLMFSCKVARIPSPLTVDEWMSVTAETLRANRLRSAYIRPLVFRGYDGSVALDARRFPVDAILATVPWATYFGEDALREGVDAQVSSWRRPGSGAGNTLAKIGGQYVQAQSIAVEARDNGFDEGIALDIHGYVSEGSGQNVFVVHKSELITPPLGSSVLSGVTRSCVMAIADDLGIAVREEALPREMLHLADEVFFTGTAAEVCPVRSVDRLQVGDGRRGPVTKAIQDMFFGIVRGARSDKWSWLTRVRVDAGDGS